MMSSKSRSVSMKRWEKKKKENNNQCKSKTSDPWSLVKHALNKHAESTTMKKKTFTAVSRFTTPCKDLTVHPPLNHHHHQATHGHRQPITSQSEETCWCWEVEKKKKWLFTFWWDPVLVWTPRQASMMWVQPRHVTGAIAAWRRTPTFLFVYARHICK